MEYLFEKETFCREKPNIEFVKPYKKNMIWYIVPLLVILVFYQYNADSKKYLLSFLALVFVYCSGYMTGSDWRAYEQWYEEANLWNMQFYEKEEGYYLIMLFFKYLEFDFFLFSILVKSLCLGSFFFFVWRKFSTYETSFFVIFSLIALQGAFLFVNCPFRNLITIAIFLFAFEMYFTKKLFVYILLMLLASTIHSSAIVILIITVLYKFFHQKLTHQVILMLYIMSIIFSAFPIIFKDVLISFQNYSTFLESKVEGYILNENVVSANLFSLGSIFNIIIFIIIYKNKNLFKNKEILILNLGFLSLIVYRLGMIVPIFSRFYLYLILFYIISISLVILRQYKKYSFIWIVYCFITLFSVINGNFAYLPYSNYWIYYLEGDFKSYDERSDYNINAWFKKYQKMPGEE